MSLLNKNMKFFGVVCGSFLIMHSFMYNYWKYLLYFSKSLKGVLLSEVAPRHHNCVWNNEHLFALFPSLKYKEKKAKQNQTLITTFPRNTFPKVRPFNVNKYSNF